MPGVQDSIKSVTPDALKEAIVKVIDSSTSKRAMSFYSLFNVPEEDGEIGIWYNLLYQSC